MEIAYRPSPWGHEFHSLPHDEALGAGAAGPGKTTVLIAEPLYQIAVEHERCEDPDHEYPLEWGASVGWALYLRRTFPMLAQTLVRARTMFMRMDPGVRFNVKDSTFVFTSGFRYQFGQCQHRDDWEAYFSNEYTMICFDELVGFEEEQYEQISGRCRTTDPVLAKMKKVRAMSNPLMRQEEGSKIAVRNPHWVRERFVDPAPLGRVTLETTIMMDDDTEEIYTSIYLPAVLSDNPNKEFVRQYEKTLKSKPAHIVRAMLRGDWYSVAGGFYAEAWNPDLHICRPFEVPDEWLQFRAMDWGYKSWGTIGLFAMDDDENIYLHRELNFRGKDAYEVGKDLRRQEKSLGLWAGGRSRLSGPADTNLWEERGNVGRSKAAEFVALGIGWTPADKRSRVANAARLTTRLKDHANGTQTPGIVIFSSCHETIKTLPQIQTNPDDPEEPQKGGADHWHDMICYACAYASNGHKGIAMRSKRAAHHSRPRVDVGHDGYGSTL